MFELTPLNRKIPRRTNGNFVDVFNMMDNFFNNDFFPIKNFTYDTFRIDVKDNDKEYFIEAELPGVQKEEVQLDYHDGNLIIAVEKNEEINEEKENYIHRERKLSSTKRGIMLKDVKAEDIQAKLEDGVLKITAPKTEGAKNKINIQVQ
ncbi:MAG: Hsp20 family protein [Eubacteriales bacterium]